MVEWSRDYYIDPATTGLNAVYRSSTGSDETDEIAAPGRHGRAASVNIRLPPSESSTGIHLGCGGQSLLNSFVPTPSYNFTCGGPGM